MIDAPNALTPLRVLLSEGTSTSAREAVTVLGLMGHSVEVCDPAPWCLARISRFVRKFHRCPGLRDDAAGFLSFVETLLTSRRFDVLLPIHEQGFMFARVQQRISGQVGIALPGFESYRIAHSKAGFSRLLDALALPQPSTRIPTSAAELRSVAKFPCVVKTSIGTASRGVWMVRDDHDLNLVIERLNVVGVTDEVLVQDFVAGAVEKAQAVFYRGRLLGFHAFRQIAAGAGGGDAIKQSVRRPNVRTDVAKIGGRLNWHGALSVDYVMSGDSAPPLYIDCNPRLVEPMSAYLSGVNLVELLLRISQGQTSQTLPDSRDGVRTHLAMQALLGCGLRGGSRCEIAAECWRLLTRRGQYAGSVEELTPVRLDWLSAVPAAATAILLLVAPKLAATLAQKGWGAHLLDAGTVRLIERDDFGQNSS